MSVHAIHSAPLEPHLIEFYNHYNHKSCLKKICDIVASLFRDLLFVLMIPYLRCSSCALYESCSKPTWSRQSAGLVVLVHGLNGHPSIWKTHIKELKKHPNIDLYVPFVHLAGNCSLTAASSPIQNKIADYIRRNPLKPICLIGFSNGSRIVTSIERNLRDIAPETTVKVSTIAGVHFGSTLINRISNTRVVKNFLHPSVRLELAYRSKTSQELLQRVRQPLPSTVSKRDYEFYASTNDLAVPNIDSSLPYLNLGERFHVVHGYGHKSIVSAVAKQQLHSCIKWIKAN